MTNNMVHNCETGEVSFIAFTEEELAMQQEIRLSVEAEEAQAEMLLQLKASAKAKLIAGQPLTVEEAEVLIV